MCVCRISFISRVWRRQKVLFSFFFVRSIFFFLFCFVCYFAGWHFKWFSGDFSVHAATATNGWSHMHACNADTIKCRDKWMCSHWAFVLCSSIDSRHSPFARLTWFEHQTWIILDNLSKNRILQQVRIDRNLSHAHLCHLFGQITWFSINTYMLKPQRRLCIGHRKSKAKMRMLSRADYQVHPHIRSLTSVNNFDIKNSF